MKTLIAIIIIILLAILGFWYFSGQETTPGAGEPATMDQGTDSIAPGETANNSNTNPNTNGTDAGMIDDGTITNGADEEPAQTEAREFTIDGSNFQFAPNSITVREGELVRIIFRNTGGTHDFVIDEFDVATEQLATGERETVEFIADQKGRFEFYCSIGTHRQMGMVGTLIVE